MNKIMLGVTQLENVLIMVNETFDVIYCSNKTNISTEGI